jgi:hypothetical protein
MVFEEFFKKKRIDLAALQAAEPACFLNLKITLSRWAKKVSIIPKNTGSIN